MARRKLIPDEEPKTKPAEEDLRHDDLEYDPQAVEAIEPKSHRKLGSICCRRVRTRSRTGTTIATRSISCTPISSDCRR